MAVRLLLSVNRLSAHKHKHILTKYFKGYNEDIDINQMPPKLTEDEKKQADGGTKGGWVEVLKYCENQEKLESIVQSLSNI